MNKSWRVASVAGIDISVHWSLAILLAWLLWATANATGWQHGLAELLLVSAMFGCIVLHELGHAFAARFFGIPTHGITLMPIGGVAQLDRIPRDPRQEMVIALAGPAVNVFLIGLLFPLIVSIHAAQAWGLPAANVNHYATRLLWMNAAMIAFNLIPAFPMDGGRVLRALLATRIEYVRATAWARGVAMALAAVLAVVGWYFNPLLLLSAAFVGLAAHAEFRAVVAESWSQLLATPRLGSPTLCTTTLGTPWTWPADTQACHHTTTPVLLIAYTSQTGLPGPTK